MSQVQLHGKALSRGEAVGAAMVTKAAVNFTAAFTKPPNLLPSKRALFLDEKHEWYGESVQGKILVFPSCIGSTHTGLVLLDLVSLGHGPAALITQSCDPLLLSGCLLSDVWYEKSIPVVEYKGDDLFDKINTGSRVKVDGVSGEITIG